MSNNKRRFFLRYISIIQRLRTNPASFDEMESYLKRQSRESGEDLAISKRTFQRDINDIREIFDIDIKTDSSNNYLISDDGDLERMSRVLETFDQLDLLYRTKTPSKYIYYEKRKSAGTENVYGILHAIHNRLPINFKHEKYWEDSLTYRIVEPYALKESHHRWYLIAKDRKDNRIKTFGLDRMSELHFEKVKFDYPKDFDADEMFKYCYGVIAEKGNPVDIILSFDPEQRMYLGSLQIHESQEVIVNNKDEYRIKLRMHATYDLIKEILSYGEDVAVIAPTSLKNEIQRRYKSAMKLYS